jgi:hypothetical protein
VPQARDAPAATIAATPNTTHDDRMEDTMKHPLLHLATLMFALALAQTGHAARLLIVGTGTDCTHDAIQDALDEVENGSGDYIVRITRSIAYSNVHAHIQLASARDLIVEGGYASCTGSPDTTNTVLSGSGSAGSVLYADVAAGAFVHVRRLELRDGTPAMGLNGSGIDFHGDGILDVSDSFITANHAFDGGGIRARGTGSNAELVIGANVVIGNNIADFNGGGIYADQVEMSMLEPGSLLSFNHADGTCDGCGHGGGLYVHAGSRSSYAYIGSGGVASLGAVHGNSARYGGGVALGGENDNHGTDEYAELWLFSTDAEHRGKIAGNFASVAGGAIHVQSSGDSVADGKVFSYAKLWNAVLSDNGAPRGGAVYLDGDIEGDLVFNTDDAAGSWPAGAVRCSANRDCGRITNNDTSDGNGSYTENAILEGGDGTVHLFRLGCLYAGCALPTGGIVIEGNRGGRLIDNPGKYAELDNVLIDGNQFTRQLIRVGYLYLHDSSLAGNSIGAGTVLSTSDLVEIKRSVLWQPGLTTLENSGQMRVDHVMASEIDSLGGNFGGGGDCGGGVCAILADPRFIDPAHGDYGLRVASPAIDVAPPIAGDDRDTSGNPRDQDLPFTFADNGVRDLGAFERQSLQPMVLNGDFDFGDLRLWTHYIGEWDGTENVTGITGSGSWTMHTSGLTYRDVNVGEQCVQLPGPGRYLLSGWGKGGGSTVNSRDYAVLAWEYRSNGGVDCNDGAVDASGELTLGQGTSWGHPAQPAYVDVPEADFVTGTPWIKLRLIARDGSPTNVGGPISAWFDGITMDVTSPGCSGDPDTLFCNGFE